MDVKQFRDLVFICWLAMYIIGGIQTALYYVRVPINFSNFPREVFSKRYFISIIFELVIFTVVCTVNGFFSNLFLIVDGKELWKITLSDLGIALLVNFTSRCQCLVLFTRSWHQL